MSLEDLLKRVDACSGPDRKLSDLILLACGWRTNYELKPLVGQSYVNCADEACWYPPGEQSAWVHGYSRPDPAASLDDAIELAMHALPGTYWYVCAGRARVGEPLFGAQFVGHDESGVSHDEPLGIAEHEASAPLAVLSALLRALISQKEGVE